MSCTPLLDRDDTDTFRWSLTASDAEPDSPPIAEGTCQGYGRALVLGADAQATAMTAAGLTVVEATDGQDDDADWIDWSMSDGTTLTLTITRER